MMALSLLLEVVFWFCLIPFNAYKKELLQPWSCFQAALRISVVVQC